MTNGRRTAVLCGLTLVTVAGLACVVAARGDDIGRALALFPLWALAACTLLHLLTLLARSEAWRLSLAAIDGRALPRSVVHGANAGAFCGGALMSHCAMPVRVALLKRFAGARAPKLTQIVVADAPIFLLELLCASALLALAGWLWALPAAFGVLLAVKLLARRLPGRPAVRGLAVLCDPRLARQLTSWVVAITLAGALRIWLILSLLLLPSAPHAVASTFASLGIFGLLPLGPSAPAAGTVAASGGDQLSAELAAGLMVAASTLLAVLLYGLLIGSLRLRSIVANSASSSTASYSTVSRTWDGT